MNLVRLAWRIPFVTPEVTAAHRVEAHPFGLQTAAASYGLGQLWGATDPSEAVNHAVGGDVGRTLMERPANLAGFARGAKQASNRPISGNSTVGYAPHKGVDLLVERRHRPIVGTE